MTATCLRVFVCAAALVGTAFGQSSLDDLIRVRNAQARRASSADPDAEGNRDARPIDPLKTLVLADLEGPGVITHIWTTVSSRDPFYPRSLVLRIFYDGSERPSVEAPLGDFFAVGHGTLATLTSLPVSVTSQGRARNCFWRMPFRKRVKITVTNDSRQYRTDAFYYYVDWLKYDQLPAAVAYFHARYRQQTPAAPGDYTILETSGRGHYVGTVYSAQQVEYGWFGEGDDKFYIDGETAPSLRGTGTEDYFSDGWGFRRFSTPYYGVPVWEGDPPGGRVTAYRWHVVDPIPFRKSLKVTIEHKGSVFDERSDPPRPLTGYVERPDWVSSVAFWYQSPAAVFDSPIAPVETRTAPYRVLRAGELDARAEPADGLSGKSVLSYTPKIANAAVEASFETVSDGSYQVGAAFARSLRGGRYQPYLDGKPLGREVDLFYRGEEAATWDPLGTVPLKAGRHTLRFECRGASSYSNPSAPAAYDFGLEYVVLLRLEDLTGYHVTLQKLQAEK